jgi:hypothetical protein
MKSLSYPLFLFLFLFFTQISYAQDEKTEERISFSPQFSVLSVRGSDRVNNECYGASMKYVRQFRNSNAFFYGGEFSAIYSYGYEPLSNPEYVADKWRNISIMQMAPVIGFKFFKKIRTLKNMKTIESSGNLILSPAVRLRNHVGVDTAIFQGALINGYPQATTELLYYREFREQKIDVGINAEIEAILRLNKKIGIGAGIQVGYYTNRILITHNFRYSIVRIF